MEISISVNLIISLFTILGSVLGAFITLKTTLVKHEQKIDSIKLELDDIKDKRESDFSELRSDLKGINKAVSEISVKIAVIEERTKK